MYDDSYLVPANAKRGTLWLNFLRPIDAIILGVGAIVTFVLLMVFASSSALAIILSIIPLGISVLLVVPIPNYHNTLCAIQSIISYFTERRIYVWKGWCFYERFLSDEKSKK